MNIVVSKIWAVLHFFHRPFSRIISQQLFRYLACGSFLAFFDAFSFFIVNNLILHQLPVFIGHWKINPYDFALWTLFPLNFTLGFLSSKYVVFPGSHLPHGKQLFRYVLLVIISFFLSNLILNFFIEKCHINDVLAKLCTTLLVACFSFLWQRFFAFKKKKEILPG